MQVFDKSDRERMSVAFVGGMMWILIFAWIFSQSPRTAEKVQAIAKPTAALSPSLVPTSIPLKKTVYVGIASYYSRAGCIGCSKTLTMANGEPLDDSRLTVAFNRAPLNSFVKIINHANGRWVMAKVTDRGGFERLGRIIDLTIATRDAIGCTDLCEVGVSL